MARRSPTNARYQKYQEPAGKTRKSAAAAKPSRKSADGGSSSSSKSKKPAPGARRTFDPQTPEFRALRQRWWTLLIVGVVLVTASWGIRYIDKPGNPLHDAQFAIGSFGMSYAGLLSAVTLGLAYACIFYALYLDFAKMRPLRQGASQPSKSDKSAGKTTAKADKSAEKSDKPADKTAKSDTTDTSTD